MKGEVITTREKIFNLAKNYSLKLLFMKAMYFMSGILVSRGVIFGSYHPFGMSLSGSAPSKVITPAVFGALIGYLFPLRLSMAVRYISTVVAITAIRWTLNDLKKIKNHFLYTPLIVFFSSFVTGLAVNSAEGFTARDMSVSLLEAIVAACASIFFDATFKILSSKKIYALNSKDIAYISVSLSIVLLSVSETYIGSVSLGRVLAVTMILTAAYAMSITGGAISGIACGVIFSLPSFGLTHISGSYAFAGMVSGLCASFGKIGMCVVFLFSNTLVSFLSGDITKMISGLYESIIAIAIFVCIPNSLLDKVKNTSPSFSEVIKSDGAIEAVTHRLQCFSQSLHAIPSYIERISKEFLKSKELNFKNMCMNSVYSTCSKCSLCKLCWSVESEDTHNNFRNILDIIPSNVTITSRDFSDTFLKRCRKSDLLAQKLTRSYEDFCTQKVANAKMSELSKVALEQFGAVSYVADELVENISKRYTFDKEFATKVKSKLLELKIKTNFIICKKDEQGKLFMEIGCPLSMKDRFTNKLINHISKLCGRKMNVCTVNIVGDNCFVYLCEPKNLKVEVGFSQHAYKNGKYCGDSYCNFEDSDGRFNVIISDGMGTGGEAAIQGTLTSSLMKNFIKSGMGFNASLKFVNSVLLSKPGEESLSTIDALSINLFSGEAKFMKAGSPSTFVLRGEEVIKINFESLPIGILSNVSLSYETLKLYENDLIIMLSDGATDIGEDWIIEIIKSKKYSNADELAELIVNKAVYLRKESKDDDITAVTMKVLKNI